MKDGGGRIVRPVPRVGAVTRWSIDLEWDDDPTATGWKVRRLPGHGRYRRTGQPYWWSTGLAPGVLYEFCVVAVDEDHGEVSEKAVVRVRTVG